MRRAKFDTVKLDGETYQVPYVLADEIERLTRQSEHWVERTGFYQTRSDDLFADNERLQAERDKLLWAADGQGL